ncbi:LysR family transcriptional regulator [Pseudoalteromonas denitrificans]|uniref:DNA-binding transcriptional regulator, LysR family n=1 Tax=Pseudoalteromonas denitrificans DSM 6059 TaxID=1123010 RepID=A0A1I1DSJ5_9GAMM|nr:LysR family transcriptional regulator [Pseudoalteromonas denitrificans]SFB77999.1 DNA-binding transcriptional regulator, LysR family [Pseudoalteromonas denitrificans DSM 6059]
MRLEQFKQFLALAEFRHFRQAAEHCNLSTSALTRSIQTLEQELNCELVTRSTRSVSITQSGELFLTYCANALEQFNHFKTQLSDFTNDNASKIVVGVTENTAEITPFVCKKFMEKFPDIEIEIQQQDRSSLSNKLADSELDITIDSTMQIPNNFAITEHLVYLPDQIILFANKNHALSSETTIDKETLTPFSVLGCLSKNLQVQKMLQETAASMQKLTTMKVGTFEQITGYLKDAKHLALAGIEYTNEIENNPELIIIKPEKQSRGIDLSISVASNKTTHPDILNLLRYIGEETQS